MGFFGGIPLEGEEVGEPGMVSVEGNDVTWIVEGELFDERLVGWTG
jgi:hypothetical protein